MSAEDNRSSSFPDFVGVFYATATMLGCVSVLIARSNMEALRFALNMSISSYVMYMVIAMTITIILAFGYRTRSKIAQSISPDTYNSSTAIAIELILSLAVVVTISTVVALVKHYCRN